jgi:THO complex subunit 4
VARPQPSLADRVTYVFHTRLLGKTDRKCSQPKKAQPKPVAATKGATDARPARGRGRGRGAARGERPAREKKKTVEELDAEMDDYFPAGEGNDTMVTNGNAAATGGDDTNMVDEML